MAPILLAHGATMRVVSPTGERAVALREFFVDRQVPYFMGYVAANSDMPFVVTLDEEGTPIRYSISRS